MATRPYFHFLFNYFLDYGAVGVLWSEQNRGALALRALRGTIRNYSSE